MAHCSIKPNLINNLVYYISAIDLCHVLEVNTGGLPADHLGCSLRMKHHLRVIVQSMTLIKEQFQCRTIVKCQDSLYKCRRSAAHVDRMIGIAASNTAVNHFIYTTPISGGYELLCSHAAGLIGRSYRGLE